MAIGIVSIIIDAILKIFHLAHKHIHQLTTPNFAYKSIYLYVSIPWSPKSENH